MAAIVWAVHAEAKSIPIVSALNRHVHLHACVTDGVFMPPATGPASAARPTFLPARPISQADLAAVTEKGRRRLIRWFNRTRLLDAEAAEFMLRQEHSGFSVDASVRIARIDRDVPSYFRSLEHLLRYCARPRPQVHAAGGQWRRRTHAV